MTPVKTGPMLRSSTFQPSVLSPSGAFPGPEHASVPAPSVKDQA